MTNDNHRQRYGVEAFRGITLNAHIITSCSRSRRRVASSSSTTTTASSSIFHSSSHDPTSNALRSQHQSLLTATTSTTDGLTADDKDHDDMNGVISPTIRVSDSLSSSSSSSLPSPSSSSQSVSSSVSSTTNGLSKQQQQQRQSLVLAVSKGGLNPKENRFHAPIVYHEKYSFENWPANHTFPMDKFDRIAYALQNTCHKTTPTSSNLPRPLVRSVHDFFRPYEYIDVPIDDWFLQSDGNAINGTDTTTMYETNHHMDVNFVTRFLQGQLTIEEARYIGFREQTHRVELIERTVLEVAGTFLTAQLAYQYGIASNVAGGTHHAHPTGGAGYTILNDLAITANLLTRRRRKQQQHPIRSGSTMGTTATTTLTSKSNNTDDAHDAVDDVETISSLMSSSSLVPDPPLKRVLVIDLDVHQGDGTAKFCTLWKEIEEEQHYQQQQQQQQRNDGEERSSMGGTTPFPQRLFTMSMHCASNYPRLKAHSTYDVGLRDGCTDEEYMEQLVLCLTRALSDVQPDLVLYDAGVDVYKGDKLGRLQLTEEGIRQRDRYVLETCVTWGIPVAAVVGGGYDTDIDALARRHAIVHEECAYVWRKYQMWKRG
jgi:acetoin utilization deacetylase AcuC-like enzyme